MLVTINNIEYVLSKDTLTFHEITKLANKQSINIVVMYSYKLYNRYHSRILKQFEILKLRNNMIITVRD